MIHWSYENVLLPRDVSNHPSDDEKVWVQYFDIIPEEPRIVLSIVTQNNAVSVAVSVGFVRHNDERTNRWT